MERYPEIRECEGVYPPREDSYLLFRAIEPEGRRFLEIGTGTGFIAIGAAFSGMEVYATDISDRALRCAKRNADMNGADVELIRADLFSGIKGKFDVIAFNPPYLPESGVDYGEIKRALESEEGGSALLKRFLSQVMDHLNEGGRAYFVLSSHTHISEFELKKAVKISEGSLFFEKLYVFMLSHKKDL